MTSFIVEGAIRPWSVDGEGVLLSLGGRASFIDVEDEVSFVKVEDLELVEARVSFVETTAPFSTDGSTVSFETGGIGIAAAVAASFSAVATGVASFVDVDIVENKAGCTKLFFFYRRNSKG